MNEGAAAHTLCLGAPTVIPTILMTFGVALVVAVGLLVFLSGRRPPPEA